MVFNFVSLAVNVIFFAILFIGLLQCRKHAFRAGFYFFLILIVHKISSYFYLPYLHKYMDSLVESNTPPPMGMTYGEFVSWFSFIPAIIDLLAFGILVTGIYKLWRSKAADAQK